MDLAALEVSNGKGWISKNLWTKMLYSCFVRSSQLKGTFKSKCSRNKSSFLGVPRLRSLRNFWLNSAIWDIGKELVFVTFVISNQQLAFLELKIYIFCEKQFRFFNNKSELCNELKVKTDRMQSNIFNWYRRQRTLTLNSATLRRDTL